MQIITSVWQGISEKYALSQSESKQILGQIQTAYSQKQRHYHNLHHIADLLAQAKTHQEHLEDADSVYLAIFFHDIVYHASKSNNEEKSALLAEKILKEMKVEQSKIEKISKYILATKKHLPVPEENDLQFLLDADLSILASDSARYEQYTAQIRQEYSIYPDFLYKAGRKKALQSFLEREQIFYFYGQDYEQKARKNIENEIYILNK
jgi:predicted metal-dependent HD superfamily phosphohydrolase